MEKRDFKRRPRPERGSRTAEDVFLQVGRAATLWECLEGELAELFDALVGGPQSNRAAFFAYSSQVPSDARTQLLSGALKRGLEGQQDELKAEIKGLLDLVSDARPRRNDIIHGRIYCLAERGYYLAPSNAYAARWPDGAAMYQWGHEDVGHYANAFEVLAQRSGALVEKIKAATRHAT